MPENPILLVPPRGADALRRGPAPRSKKSPLVDTGPLKPRLTAELDEAIARAAEPARRFGIEIFPLHVTLDRRALAKTSRPTGLFQDSEIEVAASFGPGRIVGAASLQATARLRSAIANPTKPDYEYEISTVKELRFWEASTDAFGLGSLEASEILVQAAAEAHRLLKFEFFPWMSLSSMWGNTTLGEYLALSGFIPVRTVGDARRQTAYLEVDASASAEALAPAYGIRAVGVSPQYGILPMRGSTSGGTPVAFDDLGEPPESTPIVGVLDTGVSVGALDPWIVAREAYDPSPDPKHGTFVAGLIVAPHELNEKDDRFPQDNSRVIDAQVLTEHEIEEPVLLERITEVIEKYKQLAHVWNCSFASELPINPDEYSTFAQELDSLSRQHGILFVQAVGNYEYGPVRSWPPDPAAALADGIASPSDAVDSLTVGSLSHLGGVTPVGLPASYTRRGPGIGGMAKPDVVHWSGDVDEWDEAFTTGVKSLAPDGSVYGSVGTSFATPVVATTAANVWADLESSSSTVVDPALVKGLVVHSALLNNSDVDRHAFRDFVGAGVPSESQSLLFTPDNVFTTVHPVDLTASYIWWKRPFPVPACLLTSEGRLRAEVFMTLSYAPPLDSAFGSECVRSNVDASFGSMHTNPESGNPVLHAVLRRHAVSPRAESEQIADGKWSPIKNYHGRFPRGVQGGFEWALRAQALERSAGALIRPQRAYIIISLRALEPGVPVYRDGVIALRALGHASTPLVATTRLRLRPGS